MVRSRKGVRLAAVVAAITFVVAANIRRDAAVGLIVLAAVFIVLERRWPLRPQPMLRNGWSTDVVHFVCDELIAAPFVVATLAVVLPVLRLAVAPAAVVVSHQSTSLRWVEALLIAEVSGYWGHRLQHQVPMLWRFHKLHHSPTSLDWLAPNRRHPVDLIGSRLAVTIPLLALGFPVPVLAAHFVVRRFQGLFVHANIALNVGVLDWLIATPRFHHWHHSDDPAAYNSNFAGELPLVDWIFGTLHLPRHQWPAGYGIGETAPAGYLPQLLWPIAPGSGPADLPDLEVSLSANAVFRERRIRHTSQ